MPDLDIDADLRLSVTSASGRHATGHLTGAGHVLRLDVDQPDVLFDAIDPADAGRLADALTASGVTVRVYGPAGPAAVIGAGASSRLGRLVTGSPAVAPSLSGAAHTVASSVRARLGRRSGVVAAVAGLVGVVLVAVFRRRRG